MGLIKELFSRSIDANGIHADVRLSPKERAEADAKWEAEREQRLKDEAAKKGADGTDEQPPH